jgi:Zn finger protein HypA/HybF involved in hydrogenase expression
MIDIVGTIKTICAMVLLGLIAYTQGRRILVRIRKKTMRCATCGRTVFERPVKKEIDGKELVFCCEHCAMNYSLVHNKKT